MQFNEKNILSNFVKYFGLICFFVIIFFLNEIFKAILLNYQTNLCMSEVISAFFEPKGQDLRSVVQISLPIKTQEYFCTHDFNGETKSELSVLKNQIVTVHQKNLNGWWFVSSCYGQGYVPQAILRCTHEVSSDSEIIPVVIEEFYQAIRDYKRIKIDEIDLKIGDFVRVIEKSLSGWWKIKNEGRIGLAPAVCLIRLTRKSSISSSESLDGSARNDSVSNDSITNNNYLLPEKSDQDDIMITKL